MPGDKKTNKLDRCVESVMKEGKTEDSAYAICQASINDAKKSITHRGTTFPGYNKPRKSNRAGKKKMVLAKQGDKVKVVHYGDTNYKHNYSAEAKKNFRARHNCSDQKDKLSAAYWACKDLWPTGSTKKSSVVMKAEDMDENPCWDGYEMVGHKEKNGKKVPNCVPKKDTKKSYHNVAPMPVMYGLGHDYYDVTVVIPVPKNLASKIAVPYGSPGNSDDDLYIVLAKMMPGCDIAKLRAVVSEFADGFLVAPDIEITGLSRFSGDQFVDVLYAAVDSFDLTYEANRLFTMLNNNDIDYCKKYAFHPHITLAYLPKNGKVDNKDFGEDKKWTAKTVEVRQGTFTYNYKISSLA